MFANPLVAVPLFLAIIVYASCLKIAGRLVRRAVLPWRRALGFAALVSVLVMVGRNVALSRSETASPWIPFVIGAAIHLGLGTWFFSGAALAPNGEPLGWRRAFGVVTVTLALLFATTFLLLMLVLWFIDNLHLN